MATMDGAAAPKTALDVYKQSFREYLWETHAVDSEADLTQLMALLHEPLPVSFRVNLHRPDAHDLMARLATDLQFPAGEVTHGTIPVNPPTPITWYPLANVAWQLDCGRVALSKSAPKHAAVRRFHSALLRATDQGTVDRQEAVSMLPVLFLDVQRGHRVLDMCASPGSKTTQALDFLALEPTTNGANTNGANANTNRLDSGMVVANDLDKKRAYMLVHRLTRNTLRNAVVTCGSGTQFPGLYVSSAHNEPPAVLQRTNVFDRVLCDVPCSGDGTLRKNQSLWKDWHIGQGLTLHPIQLELALRGAALLTVGGIMVYSTCSFNPVENEAVVAELLRRSDGALEVLDVAATLPGLRVRPGRTHWPVGWRSKSKSTHKGHLFTKQSKSHEEEPQQTEAMNHPARLHDWYERYAELPQDLKGQRILRSMFAPGTDQDDQGSSILTTQLEKTMRLVPIDQNSGGFFIAVLRKTRDLPSHGEDEDGAPRQDGLPPREEEMALTPPPSYVCKLCQQRGHYMKKCSQYQPDDTFVTVSTSVNDDDAKEEAAAEGEGEEASEMARAVKKPRRGEVVTATPEPIKEKPRETLYRPISDDVWQQLQAFYGLAIDDEGTGTNPASHLTLRERLWCRSDSAANVNYVDEGIARACLMGDALEIVNTGLKVFSKVSERGESFYRPTEEALGFVDLFFSKRCVALSEASDMTLLLGNSAHTPFTMLSKATQKAVAKEAKVIGPAVARLTPSLAINVWIGHGALLPRVSKLHKTEVLQAIETL